MTFVILTAGIDLSVGSIVGVSGMVAGAMLTNGIQHRLASVSPSIRALFETALIALTVGVGVGLINGLLITQLRRGSVHRHPRHALRRPRLGPAASRTARTFPNLVGTPDLGNTGFPDPRCRHVPRHPVIHLCDDRVRPRCGLYRGRARPSAATSTRSAATSAPRRSPAFASISSRSPSIMISGFCAAFAGLIVIASELVASHPAAGETFELNAIAAAVLGGT